VGLWELKKSANLCQSDFLNKSYFLNKAGRVGFAQEVILAQKVVQKPLNQAFFLKNL